MFELNSVRKLDKIHRDPGDPNENMSEEIRLEESSPMLQAEQAQQKHMPPLQQIGQNATTPDNTTQMTITHPSEINTYQQQCMDFEEDFMPMEFDEESNYMTGFTFLNGEGFGLEGFGNGNELEDE